MKSCKMTDMHTTLMRENADGWPSHLGNVGDAITALTSFLLPSCLKGFRGFPSSVSRMYDTLLGPDKSVTVSGVTVSGWPCSNS